MRPIPSLRLFMTATALAGAMASAHAQWQPSKPITIIVPWAAGGSTDQVTRVTAAEIEKHLNQKVVILNQPGASGSVGTKNAMEAPKDGYTWTAGGAKDLGTYKVLGMLDTSASDWNLYLNVAHIAVVGVNADTPYKTMNELLQQQIERAGKERLLAFHVCDWLTPTTDLLNDRGMMGDGVIDIPRIRGWVEAQGYEGYSEVEIFSTGNWWQREGQEVLRTCIERHRWAV